MIYVFVLLGLAQSGLQAQSCTLSGDITGPGGAPVTTPAGLALDGTAPPFIQAPDCMPIGDVEDFRGFMIGCSQPDCPVTEIPVVSPIPVAMCPLNEVTYNELIAPDLFFVQYWNDCVGSTLNNGYSAPDQGFANQMFCDLDGLGYPTVPASGGTPLSGIANTFPNGTLSVQAMVTSLGSAANCDDNGNTDRTELIQADFWIVVPSYVQQLGVTFAGASDDHALFMVGPSVSEMCATADYIDSQNRGAQGLETAYYNIPATAMRVCGGILLRARMYVSDIAQRFNVNPEFDFGNGFAPLGGNGLIYPVTSADDNIPPTLQYDPTVLTGYRDMDDNIYALQADGSFALSDHGCFIEEIGTTLMITSTETEVCLDSSITIVGSGTPATTDAYVSGTPTVATIDPATGVITTVALGMTVITYTDALGCTVDVTVTVIDCCTPDCGVFPANPAGN